MHPGRPPWPPAVINQKTTTIMLIVAAVYLCVFFFFSIWWYLIVRFYPGCVYGATTYVESFTFAIVTQMTIGARGARVGGVGMGEGWGGVGWGGVGVVMVGIVQIVCGGARVWVARLSVGPCGLGTPQLVPPGTLPGYRCAWAEGSAAHWPRSCRMPTHPFCAVRPRRLR